MGLGLDVAESAAKVDRACEHLETLKRDLAVTIGDSPPYTVRSGDIDQETGWTAFYITKTSLVNQMRFAAIVGDVHHNLRCALDYIVGALVVASGAPVTTNHQFPIFKERDDWCHHVGGRGTPLPKGYLGGVKYGVAAIEKIQPYNAQPDPRADLLWALYRFSNTDKHRQITVVAYPPWTGNMQVDSDGLIVAVRGPLGGGDWENDGELDIGAVRFRRPYPTYSRYNGNINIHVYFTAPPVKKDPERILHDLPLLEALCGHVRMIVDLFKEL